MAFVATSNASKGLVAKVCGVARPSSRKQSRRFSQSALAVIGLVQGAVERTDLRDSNLLAPAGHEDLPGERRYPGAALMVSPRADRELFSVRRGEEQETSGCDILTPMGSPNLEADITSDTASAPDGISAFVARVLDQLTLSAWLPAALFTASMAVLLEFRSAKTVNISKAVEALTKNWVPVLVLIIPVLVVATIVTQAFSFEAMRTLEGYWRRRGLASLARTMMIKRQVRRKQAIDKRLDRANEEAFYAARPQMIKKGISVAVVNALEADALKANTPTLTEEEDQELVEAQQSWRTYCDPWHLAIIDHLLNDYEVYPDDDRIMPTRLGNLIRATEDELSTDGDLQGFVLRRHAMVPRRVQLQHDRFRTRMEMYCTLMFVSAALTVLTLVVLLSAGVDTIPAVIIAVGYVVLSQASYLAAIASARGYCAALKVMNDTPERV